MVTSANLDVNSFRPILPIKLTVPEKTTPAFHLIEGRSYLADRVMPLPRVVCTPARRVPASEMLLDIVEQSPRAPVQKLPQALRRLTPFKRIQGAGLTVDLRWIGLNSWFQGVGLAPPFALMLQHVAESMGPVRFVVGRKTNSRVLHLLSDVLNEIVITDRPLRGVLVESFPRSRFVIDHYATSWAKLYCGPILEKLEEDPKIENNKLFLSRKSGRNISNERELEDVLSKSGFKKVYLEDLSIYKQISLLCHATDIVAIHGAALTPLIYRNSRNGPLRLIEIMSPGHVVPSFRNRLLHLEQLEHLAILGTPDPSHARDAYDLSMSWREYEKRHSRRSFAVDCCALEIALQAKSTDHVLETPWE